MFSKILFYCMYYVLLITFIFGSNNGYFVDAFFISICKQITIQYKKMKLYIYNFNGKIVSRKSTESHKHVYSVHHKLKEK